VTLTPLYSCRHLFISTALLLLYTGGIQAQSTIITTIAGTGYHGTTGDNSPATCAGVPYPECTAVDLAGNVYITTSNNVRKVDAATGIITSVAGSDYPGYTGDGGPAVNARMGFPFGVCVDASGNLYITDYSKHCVRKVTAATGIITTLAGNGSPGYSGDGGPATSALLQQPQGIAIDSKGNLYIADFLNSRVRKIDAATGIISTIAGTGGNSASTGDGGPAAIAETPYPSYVCVDKADNIYEVEVNNTVTSRVRKIDAVTGIITTVAGNGAYAYGGDNGPAVSASLLGPTDVCVDGNGNLYIDEYDDSRIRKVDAITGIITTIAGTGTNGFGGDGRPPAQAQLYYPTGICADGAGSLYIADFFNQRIRKIYSGAAIAYPYASVSITADNSSICTGSTINFTATVTNDGPTPTYEWQKNGAPVGTNSPLFSSNTLVDGDIIVCGIPAYATTCGAPTLHMSNSIVVHAGPPVTPAVLISADATQVCTGTPVNFTAVATNGGIAPTYQWLLNGSATGSGPTYTSSTLQNGDFISCLLQADVTTPCLLAPGAVSNSISMLVKTVPAPSIQITASPGAVCEGDPVTYQAIAGNAGDMPSYQWLVNGNPVGDGLAEYVNSHPANGDQVSCRMIPSETECPLSLGIVSNILSQMVYPLPVIQFDPPSDSITAGQQVRIHATLSGATIQSYEWSPAGSLADPSSLTPLTLPLQVTTVFQLQAIGMGGCQASKNIIVKVLGKFNMPSAFTPNGDGKNDVFRVPPRTLFTLRELAVYDRWGARVFSTTDIGQGWDGTYSGHPSPAGVYVYTISGAEGGKAVLLTGTVLLIR
jgi:gliding motility-associated-like protein